MRRVLILACVAALALGTSSAAFAGSQDGARVLLHAGTYIKGYNPCTWAGLPCSDYATTWQVGGAVGAYLYLNVAQGAVDPGVAAVSCGVLYNPTQYAGVDMFGFTLCTSGLQFPNAGANGDWPASGGGNRITWDASIDCQRTVFGTDGVHALAGAFYVYAYSADVFAITPNNNLSSGIPEFQVGDCSNSVSDLDYAGTDPTAPHIGSHAGTVGFGGDGYNPCLETVPVEPTTWGKVKSQY